MPPASSHPRCPHASELSMTGSRQNNSIVKTKSYRNMPDIIKKLPSNPPLHQRHLRKQPRRVHPHLRSGPRQSLVHRHALGWQPRQPRNGCRCRRPANLPRYRASASRHPPRHTLRPPAHRSRPPRPHRPLRDDAARQIALRRLPL